MRLSSLKLVGFKSFAESSTLHFKDNRTAIVGPNGCGKSNVIDAIRWVMGESSAKQLRGGNMQDVIFAGTTNRKPVGVASVELRFENTYGELGGEYNAYTELSVKRQVTRDGKSDYFLNGTKCRRKDITDIFLGTGLGPRSYAVIEQGMINRLVDAKPEEMRVFIEEAAGISRYQARRKETVQHLEHTQSNLSRLKDIALELQSQIRTLKRQAEQAEKYQSLQQEIVSYKVQLFSQQYAQIFRQVDTLTKQLTTLTEDYQTRHKALEQIEIEGHLLQQRIQKQLPQAEKLQQAWQKAQQSYQQILWRLEQNQTQQDQINQSIDSLQQQQQQFQDEFVQIQQELEKILSQYQHTEKLLRELEQVGQDSQIDVIALQTRFEQQSQEFQTEQQYLTQLQQQQKQLQYQLEQIQKTNGRTELSLQQLQAQRQQFNNEESIFLLEELNIEVANNQIKFDEQMTVQQKLKCVLDEKNQQKNELYQKVQEIELTEKSLQREIQQTEKLLMNMKQDEDIEVKHPLVNQLQLTYQGQQYSALIEKILAKWLMAETSTEMDWVYQGARQLKLSERSERIHTIDLPSMETWINLPNHSLWQSIYIAQNIDEAKTFITMLLPQDSIVTEDGFWLGQDWLINLNLDDQNVAQGQLHYHIHLKELKQQQQLKCSELEPLIHQLDTLNGELLLDKEQLNLIQQQTKVLESNKSQLLTEQTKLQTSIDHNIKNAEQIVLHIEQLKSQWSDDVQEQEQLQFDLVSLQLKIEDIQPKVDAKVEQFEKNKARLTEVKQRATDDQQQLQQLQLQAQQLQSKQALLQRDEQFKAEKIEFVTEQLLDTRLKLQRLEQDVQLAQNNEQDARLKAEYEHQQWKSWQQQVESLQTQQNQQNEQRLIQQQSESELRDQLEQTRLQWQQKKTDQQHILEQLQQLGQPKPIEHSEINITFIQSKLEKAEQQFAKLGAINLAAFEELQQLQVRYDELNHQIQDLEQTIEQLHTAMKSIDQETKHLFMKTFDQVNKELQDLFPKVFSGGEASLSLDGDWQSGVRLMARPPGKRNSTLALLSGGEKALTALALVFGIFRLNPAPFCVLDEVDAPLDDANVGRFCNLVTELSQQVQFIYITHNKVAMTMATDLLGVTMPEAGSSKLVAVSLAQAEAYGMTAE